MSKLRVKKINVTQILFNHIKLNLKEYIIVLLMFIVGVFLGVMFLNNTKNEQKEEISEYINNYISKNKESNNITTSKNLSENIKDSIKLTLALWFLGTTLIGIPLVLGIILYRGFCLGYSVSACTYTLGQIKGISFVIISLLLQNLLLVPAIFALGVSGIKLYKSIIRDKRKENIKIEVLRHTVLSILMLMLLIISSIVKINVSGGMIEMLIKYF